MPDNTSLLGTRWMIRDGKFLQAFISIPWNLAVTGP